MGPDCSSPSGVDRLRNSLVVGVPVTGGVVELFDAVEVNVVASVTPEPLTTTSPLPGATVNA